MREKTGRREEMRRVRGVVQSTAGVAGLVGVSLIVLGALVTALWYSGRAGQPYFAWNHFVSELGEPGVSSLATVFNAGLVAGGICILLFVVGLSLRLRGPMRVVLTVLGVIAGVFAALVGVIPMSNLPGHAIVANGFFYSGMITMIAFSINVLVSPHRELPRWTAVPGFAAAASLVVFLFLGAGLERLVNGEVFAPDFAANRPAVWVAAITEWVAVGAVLVWVAIIAGVLTRIPDE